MTLKHFEELWVEAEKSSISNYNVKSNMEVFKELSDTVDMMLNYTEGLGSGYYEPKIGKLLYLISVLSEREKINVYAALRNTIELKEKEKSLLSEIDMKQGIDPVC
jgi:hypothetical protein